MLSIGVVTRTFSVSTPGARYEAVVERECLRRLGEYVPPKTHRIFVVTTEDVWSRHGERLAQALAGRTFHPLFFPGGEARKRMSEVEALAEQMVALGGERSSLVVSFGGGIVTDLGGFLAAIFMRGIPVIQVPTTLLAQVDAAVGGKTGTNLVSGKNLIGAFHQPLAVLIDPTVLATLPEREFRAGLQEILKCGIIRSRPLFDLMADRAQAILAQDPAVLDEIIAESVRIKAEVVSADEKEGGLRRILNYGHTIGHALEAETQYQLLLHGEAVALGMKAANHLSRLTGSLSQADCHLANQAIDLYGPFPSVAHIPPSALLARLGSDKKAIAGQVHFVLAQGIGDTKIVTGLSDEIVTAAITAALA
jgi:3-dehydroquinate synthase